MGIVLQFICTNIIAIGHPKGKPWTGWRRKAVALFCKLAARNALMMMSAFSINKKRAHTVNYSKYLGPDWKAEYDNPSTIVSNHSTFLDIIVAMCRQPPSHIAKYGVKKIPFVGPLAESVGCLFIDRGDKGQRADMLT